MGEEGVVKSSI